MDKTIQHEISLLDLVAEEASELAHASLKVSRILLGVNPTPITIDKAVSNLIEECADVELCIAKLVKEGYINKDDIMKIVKEKNERWNKRLKGEM